jgi:cysteine peptidase C11 family protein
VDDLTALAAAFAALVAIGCALYYLFKWQPVRKPWCVILYHVSRETNAGFDWPNPGTISGVNALDEKLDQVVGVLDSLPCGSVLTFVKTKLLGLSAAPQGVDWEDAHVLYRAVWNGAPFRPEGKQARARIVTWRPSAPSIPDDQIFGSPMANDRDGFLQWAYQNCPADHYALFYWGHSIGPGGLFELNSSVKFPPLPAASGLAPASLIDVATTLQLLQDLRLHGKITTPLPEVRKSASPSGGTPPPSGGTLATPGATPAPANKLDVVLFQDCWMNTLETAFELQDIARYVVGSQSLVPIGYTYTSGTMSDATGPVWPYEAMIARMLASPTAFIDAVANELKTFYAVPAARAPFPVSIVSVMDLGLGNEVGAIVKPAIQDLVSALSMLTSVPYGEAYRWAFLDGGGTTYTPNPVDGRPDAGDWALRDVVKLCKYLSDKTNHPAGVAQDVSKAVEKAAKCVIKAIDPLTASPYSLVKTAFTVPATASALFEGVSILWMPGLYAAIPAHDGFLAKQVDSAFYQNLRLVTDTKAGDSWATFAFEQLS